MKKKKIYRENLIVILLIKLNKKKGRIISEMKKLLA